VQGTELSEGLCTVRKPRRWPCPSRSVIARAPLAIAEAVEARELKGVSAEWERDFVDVRFQLDGETYVGEIKVTTTLRLEEAFQPHSASCSSIASFALRTRQGW
jgi:hypothetical protein